MRSNRVYIPVLPCHQRREAMVQVKKGSILYGHGNKAIVLDIEMMNQDIVVHLSNIDEDGNIYDADNATITELRDLLDATVDLPELLHDNWQEHPDVCWIIGRNMDGGASQGVYYYLFRNNNDY